MGDPDRLPSWVTWQHRPFPDANLLLLPGRHPVLVNSGFVGHAGQTADWVHARTGQLSMVVNTHWHADHVGGNAMLQARGDRDRCQRPGRRCRHPPGSGLLQAEYLDQPVAPYTVDQQLRDGQILPLGAAGRSLPLPGTRRAICACGSPTSSSSSSAMPCPSYDVGWVNLALDGPDVAAIALASLQRLIDLAPRVLIPAHGPIPAGAASALTAARRRARRLVNDPDGAVWYGARRIFAYALMIRDGIPVTLAEPYLHKRTWLIDAARLLGRAPDVLATELVESMLRNGSIVARHGRLHAAAEHVPVSPASLDVPFPHAWPAPGASANLGSAYTSLMNKLVAHVACALATQQRAAPKPSLTCVNRSGRRESNPHDQLGRLGLYH